MFTNRKSYGTIQLKVEGTKHSKPETILENSKTQQDTDHSKKDHSKPQNVSADTVEIRNPETENRLAH